MKKMYPIAVLIGAGSRLPAVLEYEKRPDSLAKIVLVISHKKESPGVNLAIENGIPAIYFNLVKWRNRTGKTRQNYMDALGFLVSQYEPHLIALVGWDLVLDKNFTKYFSDTPIINLHPAILPENDSQTEVNLPDGTKSPVFRGEKSEIFKQVLKSGVTHYGCTIHYIKPAVADVGKPIVTKIFKLDANETEDSLEQKLYDQEFIALPEAINKVLKELSK